MKITHELLQKYARGQCNLVEEAAIEAWLQSEESESSDLSSVEIANMQTRMMKNFEQRQTTKVIPLYKKFARFAAAAAVILMAFGAGYFVDKGHSEQIVRKEVKEDDGIIIYGANGVSGRIPGESFKLNFDGQLKLFNPSNSIKTVVVGLVTYILKPQKDYYIYGNIDNSSILVGNFEKPIRLEGHFGISVVKS
ncbi:MAG: hypothetical protein AAGC64_12065 [Bacteroidota bacterium]